jgi:hypothetical protein
MIVTYKNVYTLNASINSLNLTCTYDGYHVDGYHLTISDGYATMTSTTYFVPETEVIIPLPFPNLVNISLCLDLTNGNEPCIVVDEVYSGHTPYKFDGSTHYRLIESLAKISKTDLENQSISFLNIILNPNQS